MKEYLRKIDAYQASLILHSEKPNLNQFKFDAEDFSKYQIIAEANYAHTYVLRTLLQIKQINSVSHEFINQLVTNILANPTKTTMLRHITSAIKTLELDEDKFSTKLYTFFANDNLLPTLRKIQTKLINEPLDKQLVNKTSFLQTKSARKTAP